MKSKKVAWLAGILLAAIAIVGLPSQNRADTPPGVARVSLMQGDVTTMRGDSGQWVATTVNTPLETGDQIATGAGSRAEVQLDYADVIRLDQNTVVKIADLTRSRIQLQVAQGQVDYVVLSGAQAKSEVDTPNVAIQPIRPGTYRLDVNSQGESELIVRRGEAQASTPQGSATVRNGQIITVRGINNPEYHIADAPARDGWDSWNSQRNRAVEDAQSWHYTNHYYTVAQDLGGYGHWVLVPGYGWCWTPYASAGWVPYRYGRWVWEPYYGWTWVSYEPWGWAPYHYGRWMFWDDDWVWWPGYVTPAYYPVWAPAYVTFFGFGYGRWNFGFGFGYGFNSIGWCPLGPGDDFHPWWGGRSFNVVNITNITNITNVNQFNNIRTQRIIGGNGRSFYTSNVQGVLANPRMRGGVTVVPTNQFGRGYVPHHLQPVNFNRLGRANIVRGTLPVVPTRASLSPINRPAVVPAVARTMGNTRFFTRHPVPAISRSFNAQAAGIQHMIETRGPIARTNFGNTVASARANVRPGGPQRNTIARGGFANARVNSTAGVARRGSGFSGPTQRSGWHNFGAPQARIPTNRAQGFVQARPGPSQSFTRPSAPARGWQRFGGQPQAARRIGQGSPLAPSRFASRPAPSANFNRQGANRSWQQFTPQPRTAPRGNSGARFTQPRATGAWNAFTPHAAPTFSGRSYGRAPSSRGRYFGGRPSYSAPRPRGYSRPALRLNHSLVAPRNFGGGRRFNGGGRSFGGGRGGAVFHGGGRSFGGNRGGGFHGGGRSFGGNRGGGFHGGGRGHGRR